MHNGPIGGHYGGETTAHKILRAGYYWPIVFRESHAYTRKCKVCQTVAGRERNLAVPLRLVMIHCPLQQWGLDVIGEITLNSSQQHNYILIVTNYFTRWTEAIPLWKVNEDEVISFIDKFIINKFGIPDALIFDNASYFSSLKLTEFAINKSIRIRNWHNALTNALWANRVTPIVALGNSSSFLIYGQEAIFPPNVTLPSLQLSQASRGTPSALLQKRINQLVRLEELRDKAINKFTNHQMIVKRCFDHHLVGDKDYQVGELVLKWDKLSEPKGKHMKFQHLWLGPVQVEEKIS
eukprot:PITA_06479